MPASPLHFDVVIAGGGFAGVYCARALEAELGHSARDRVALVANENFMLFQPMLAEVVGSALSPRHVVNPIRQLCRKVTVLRGEITGIDLDARQLTVSAGDFVGDVKVTFRHLVAGLGGIVDLSRVPGMAEHAFLMKNIGDALKLRDALISRFEEANLEDDPEDVRRLLTFVIVGGGFSGVETAGQLLDFTREMVGFYPRLPADALRVVLIHGRERLMPELSASLAKYCEANLRNRGLEIVLNARVTGMTAGRIHLEDGRVFESRTVVSTVGNAPHPLLSALEKKGLPCDKGRLLTDATLRVKGRSDVWAAGDCAAVPMPPNLRQGAGAPSSQEFSPSTAQFATRQGALLGKNLARTLRGGEDLQPFNFRGLGELASLGHRAAAAEILGLKFSGFFAWWLWRSVYLLKLPGIERKLRVLLDWTLDLFFPADITSFRGQPTQVLKLMRVEKGDVLCHAGEPAFSFYIVKAGLVELRNASGAVERTMTPGRHFGKSTVLHDLTWPYTAVAAEPSEVMAIGAQTLKAIRNTRMTLHPADSGPK
jgi:NADH:ubiquinone reductase (H+-translocating)